MLSEPSLVVLAASTSGNVFPPSVERLILTLAQLTGAAVVPLTFQVTVCVPPPVQVTAVFGAVTANGPAAAVTFTVVEALETPPPPARLSRTTALKVIVRVIVGIASPKLDVLLRMSPSF